MGRRTFDVAGQRGWGDLENWMIFVDVICVLSLIQSKKSVRFLGPETYNSLSEHLKVNNTLTKFQNYANTRFGKNIPLQSKKNILRFKAWILSLLSNSESRTYLFKHQPYKMRTNYWVCLTILWDWRLKGYFVYWVLMLAFILFYLWSVMLWKLSNKLLVIFNSLAVSGIIYTEERRK